jgi:hypothetical protein
MNSKLSILKTAQETVERNMATYGHPVLHHTRTISMINGLLGEEYLKKPLPPEMWSKFMILDKLARSMESYKPDNMLDTAGYAETHEMVKNAELAKGFMEGVPEGVPEEETLRVVPIHFGRTPDPVQQGDGDPGQDQETSGGGNGSPENCPFCHPRQNGRVTEAATFLHHPY